MTTPKNTDLHPIIRRRFRAALDLHETTAEEVARQARVSSRHLQFVLAGYRRPGPGLAAKLRAAVGDAGWAFATGQSDSLHDDRPAGEVITHVA